MVRVIYEKSFKRKVRDFIRSGNLWTILFTLFVFLAIPVTLFLALNNQDIRQRAASPSIEYIGSSRTPNLVFNNTNNSASSIDEDINTRLHTPISGWLIGTIVVISGLFGTVLVVALLNRNDSYT